MIPKASSVVEVHVTYLALVGPSMGVAHLHVVIQVCPRLESLLANKALLRLLDSMLLLVVPQMGGGGE